VGMGVLSVPVWWSWRYSPRRSLVMGTILPSDVNYSPECVEGVFSEVHGCAAARLYPRVWALAPPKYQER